MSAWQMDSGGLPTCGVQVGIWYRVEFATQKVTDAEWSGGLTAPVWTSPTVLDLPFGLNELEYAGKPDAGALGASELRFEAVNTNISQTASTVRFLDIFDSIDKDTTALHCRIGRKNTSGGAYTWRYWGTVAWDSLEISYGDIANRDTWIIKFSVRDCIEQLETRTARQLFDDILTHTAYDYTAEQCYVDFIGSYAGAVDKGAYPVNWFRYAEKGSDKVVRNLWYAQRYISGAGVGNGWLKFIRLKEMIQSISDYLGLGTSFNSSGTFGNLHNWTFGFNSASAGNTAMTFTTLDNIYILSALWDWDNSVYKMEGTFFDDTDASGNSTPFSFYGSNSALEVLKEICVSFGLIARVVIDSGNRVLSVQAADEYTTSSVFGVAICEDATVTPYAEAIEGVQITVASGSDVRRGACGNKSVNVNCHFSSCNNVRTQDVFRNSEPYTAYGQIGLGEDVCSALWVSTDTPASDPTYGPRHLASMYSVCAIVPYYGSTPAPATAYIEGGTGKYQTAAPFALNAVMYPNDAGPYNCWVEVPGMALAHYYWSKWASTYDIGLFRRKGRKIRFKVKGLDGYGVHLPGSQLTVTIGGVDEVFSCTRYKENIDENSMEFEGVRYTV